jgi:hypothetical protein
VSKQKRSFRAHAFDFPMNSHNVVGPKRHALQIANGDAAPRALHGQLSACVAEAFTLPRLRRKLGFASLKSNTMTPPSWFAVSGKRYHTMISHHDERVARPRVVRRHLQTIPHDDLAS